MKLSPKDWADFIKTLIGILVIVGTAVVWAGDYHWQTIKSADAVHLSQYNSVQLASAEQTKALQAVSDDLSLKLALIEINNLDSRITFLKIKVGQDEATASEKIYLQTLERQLRELKRKVDQ